MTDENVLFIFIQTPVTELQNVHVVV